MCDIKDIGAYYKYKNKPMAHLPFNFQLCSIRQSSPINASFDLKERALSQTEKFNQSMASKNVKRLVEEYIKVLPKKSWPNWQVLVFLN